jgi:hypothetical protein
MEDFITKFVFSLGVALIVFILNKKGRGWTSWRKTLLAAGVFFLVLFVSTFVPINGTAKHWVVAGTVEDEGTHEGVGQADVLVDGLTLPYKTEDNGNFRIELNGRMRQSERLRIRVSKTGYKPYDVTLTPPKDNLIVLLEKS